MPSHNEAAYRVRSSFLAHSRVVGDSRSSKSRIVEVVCEPVRRVAHPFRLELTTELSFGCPVLLPAGERMGPELSDTDQTDVSGLSIPFYNSGAHPLA